MNRLEYYLKYASERGAPTGDEYWVEEYENDILLIKSAIVELQNLDNYSIYDLYGDYSQAVYAAGWIGTISPSEFRNWLFCPPDASGEYYPPEWYPSPEDIANVSLLASPINSSVDKLFYLNFFFCQWFFFRIQRKMKIVDRLDSGPDLIQVGWSIRFPVIPLLGWRDGSYDVVDEQK